MLNSIKRQVGSGGEKYNVTIGFEGMDVEQIQQDAAGFYVWKLQRQIRDAGETQRETWKRDGIVIHATEVGKTIMTTEQMVDKLSPDQADKVFEILREKLGK